MSIKDIRSPNSKALYYATAYAYARESVMCRNFVALVLRFVVVVVIFVVVMSKSRRSQVLPCRSPRVGSRVRVGGWWYVVVCRPAGLLPREACSGCWFRSGTCPSLACSPFDRRDGVAVWFVRERKSGEL